MEIERHRTGVSNPLHVFHQPEVQTNFVLVALALELLRKGRAIVRCLVLFRDALPYNDTGKLLRRVLKQELVPARAA